MLSEPVTRSLAWVQRFANQNENSYLEVTELKIVDVKATRYTEAIDWVDIGKEYEIVVTEVHTDDGITGMSYIP
jgi:hypothetical protein